MRFFFSSAVIILTLSLVLGCTDEGSSHVAEAEELQTPAIDQHAVNKSIDQGAAPIDKEMYDTHEVSPVQIQDQTQIIWQEDGVSLSAQAVQSNQTEASSRISSIRITRNDHSYPIELAQAPESISSVSLSSDHQYLAMHLKYNEGHRLVIVKLMNGDYYTLNDYLSRNGRGTVDTIHSYRWAPSGNHLALAYGDGTRSSVALYQTDRKMLLDIATPVLYEDTPVMVWHKEGKGFDFVSAGEGNTFVLNRYIRGRSLVSKVKVLAEEDVASMQAITQTYAK